jgi:hypothetical protein
VDHLILVSRALQAILVHFEHAVFQRFAVVGWALVCTLLGFLTEEAD